MRSSLSASCGIVMDGGVHLNGLLCQLASEANAEDERGSHFFGA